MSIDMCNGMDYLTDLSAWLWCAATLHQRISRFSIRFVGHTVQAKEREPALGAPSFPSRLPEQRIYLRRGCGKDRGDRCKHPPGVFGTVAHLLSKCVRSLTIAHVHIQGVDTMINRRRLLRLTRTCLLLRSIHSRVLYSDQLSRCTMTDMVLSV